MIRSFIYLDSDKLRSLSSQLFEGLTEYITNSSHSEQSDATEQRGPVGTGRLVGDILSKGGSSTEFKFLEDHAYILFEAKLAEDGLLNHARPGEELNLEKTRFIRAEGKLSLVDMSEISRLFENFNKFGQSLTRVTNQHALEQRNSGKPITDQVIANLAKQNNMQMDAKFIEALSFLIKFIHQDLVSAEMIVDDRLFSAPLNVAHLRETPQNIVHKHSRVSQKVLFMIGEVTQVGKNEIRTGSARDVSEASNLKQAMRHLVDHQKILEDAFFGQQDTDVILDPIAIYSET